MFNCSKDTIGNSCISAKSIMLASAGYSQLSCQNIFMIWIYNFFSTKSNKLIKIIKWNFTVLIVWWWWYFILKKNFSNFIFHDNFQLLKLKRFQDNMFIIVILLLNISDKLIFLKSKLTCMQYLVDHNITRTKSHIKSFNGSIDFLLALKSIKFDYKIQGINESIFNWCQKSLESFEINIPLYLQSLSS